MPIKYIGRTTSFKGKPLWEILGNLKNFGVGRMVLRNRFQRYPEPCFMRILKVAAYPSPDGKTPGEERKVAVLVERTFRGKTAKSPVQIDTATYKADYVLVPKDEEEKYLEQMKAVKKQEHILPRTVEFPPLLKEVIIQKLKAKGSPIPEDLELPIRYTRPGVKEQYRIAEEGETPTVEFQIGLGTPVSPSLYANIKENCTPER